MYEQATSGIVDIFNDDAATGNITNNCKLNSSIPIPIRIANFQVGNDPAPALLVRFFHPTPLARPLVALDGLPSALVALQAYLLCSAPNWLWT
jgi:hypothetical protein